MSIAGCAELVRQGDPDRFLSAMTAPPHTRGRLMVLYAFNLELARAPWVTREPLIAEMRLQWWADVVDQIRQGNTPRPHIVATPLQNLVQQAQLPTELLTAMIAARRFDIHSDPHPDQNSFNRYVDETAGNLMWLAVRALSEKEVPLDQKTLEQIARDTGHASGVASLFGANVTLVARGRPPLVGTHPKALRETACTALRRLKNARNQHRDVPNSALPALRAAWQAAPLLTSVLKKPERVTQGLVPASEFRRRSTLLWRTACKNW